MNQSKLNLSCTVKMIANCSCQGNNIFADRFQTIIFNKFILFIIVNIIMMHSASSQTILINTFGNAGISINIGSQTNKIAFSLGVFIDVGIDKAHLESSWQFTYGLHNKTIGLVENSDVFGYEVAALVGYGESKNLLGSTVIFEPNYFIFNKNHKETFIGLGIGVKQNFYKKKLEPMSTRMGYIVFRLGRENTSFNFKFANDTKYGVFRGSGTDWGRTAAVVLDAHQIMDNRIVSLGIGLDMYTPKPYFNVVPRNKLNSDDMWYNTWEVPESMIDILHTNLFIRGGVQSNTFHGMLEIGIDSPKVGAYMQNILHDSFALFPRFPWRTDQKQRLFYSVNTGINTTVSILKN